VPDRRVQQHPILVSLPQLRARERRRGRSLLCPVNHNAQPIVPPRLRVHERIDYTAGGAGSGGYNEARFL
jgi:hypothetical protein